MSIILNFLYLHISLAYSLFPNCQKVSYQFLVYTIFLKILVLTEMSLYHINPILMSKVFTFSVHFIIILPNYTIVANKHLTPIFYQRI